MKLKKKTSKYPFKWVFCFDQSPFLFEFKTVKMKKSRLNFYLDVLMFLCMSAIAGIGFLIKYTLITGRESQIKYGSKVELSLFGLDRHEWGTVHLVISFLFLGLLALHLYLHRKTVICVFNKLVQRKVPNKMILFSFLMISSLLMVSPFFVEPKIDEHVNRNGQHRTMNEEDAMPDNTNEIVDISLLFKAQDSIQKTKSY